MSFEWCPRCQEMTSTTTRDQANAPNRPRQQAPRYEALCSQCFQSRPRCGVCRGPLLTGPDAGDALDCGGDCWACVRAAEEL